jgi:1,4-alpha-glucan branching enzyme
VKLFKRVRLKYIINQEEAMKKKESVKSGSRKNNKKSAKAKGNLNLKKLYLKTKELCKVTFRLPKEAAPEADQVTLVGDFNQWDTNETPMQKLKNGDFKVTLELACEQEYKFRYLIDNSQWENDWQADKYTPNGFGTDDSIVII